MSGTNPLAYLRWHTRDAFFKALTPALLFIAIVGIPLSELASREGLASTIEPGQLHDDTFRLYQNILTMTMTLGALLVGSGFVSKDRDAGYVRFLFSTPTAPWRFYLLRFTLALALFCAVFSLIPFSFGLLVFPVPIAPVIASAALYGFLLGSLGLLAGSITRSDGAVVIGATLLGTVLQQLVRVGEGRAPTWMSWLSQGLPPIDAADHVRTAWLVGTNADTGQLTLVLVWSAAMFVGALLIIKRAPLVR